MEKQIIWTIEFQIHNDIEPAIQVYKTRILSIFKPQKTFTSHPALATRQKHSMSPKTQKWCSFLFVRGADYGEGEKGGKGEREKVKSPNFILTESHKI